MTHTILLVVGVLLLTLCGCATRDPFTQGGLMVQSVMH